MEMNRRRYGDDVNLAEMALGQRRAMARVTGNIYTAEPCVVHDFDFAKGRVDVRLKNFPEAPILRNLPIRGRGGLVREFRPFKTIVKDGIRAADVGIAFFPRSDSSTSFNDHVIAPPNSGNLHAALGPWFDPGVPTLDDQQPSIISATATSADLDSVGPNDHALIFLDAAGTLLGYVCVKEGGEVVVKGKAKVYIGTTDKSIGSGQFKKVARDGDSAGPNTVAASQNNVFVSDG